MAIPIALTLINFLHELFTVIWVGGMLLLVFVIMPILKKQFEGEKLQQINKKIQNRLSIFTYVSIVVLMATGLLLTKLTDPSGTSYFISFESTFATLLSIKHILFILMALIAIFRSAILDRIKGIEKKVSNKISKILLLSNVIFAIVVLFLSSYLGVIALL
jgi:putative copper export protein